MGGVMFSDSRECRKCRKVPTLPKPRPRGTDILGPTLTEADKTRPRAAPVHLSA